MLVIFKNLLRAKKFIVEKARYTLPVLILRQKKGMEHPGQIVGGEMEFLLAVPSFGINLYPNLYTVNFSYCQNYMKSPELEREFCDMSSD